MAGLYDLIMEHIFFEHYRSGDTCVDFEREDLPKAAEAIGERRPKNLGDCIGTYGSRKDLPERIQATAPAGLQWMIRRLGGARYSFVLRPPGLIVPNEMLMNIKVPDATPGLIVKYARSEEQALLAVLRYNRLLDMFLGMACYSLQNHLRTQVDGDQVETDEVYIGIDARGAHYVIPVQAKGGGTGGNKDRLHVAQIEGDLKMCAEKFPDTICRPIAAQFMGDGLIALFELTEERDVTLEIAGCQFDNVVKIANERHYKLVPPEELSAEELQAYQRATS